MIGVETSPGYNYETEPIGKPQTLAFTPADFTGFPSKMNFWQRIQNVFFDRMNKIQFNKLVTLQQKYVDEIFGPGYPTIYELSTELDLVFVNSHYSLNGNQPLHAGFVEVGGLHIEDTKEKLIPVSIVSNIFTKCEVVLLAIIFGKVPIICNLDKMKL